MDAIVNDRMSYLYKIFTDKYDIKRSQIVCAYCKKEELVKLDNICCIYCNLSANVLCSKCCIKKYNFDQQTQIGACIRCVERVKNNNTCHVCKTNKWWIKDGLTTCKCEQLICSNCRILCGDCSRWFNPIFCHVCIITHRTEPCSICNKAKDYCRACKSCYKQFCDKCKGGSCKDYRCTLTPIDSCIKCYTAHFRSCDESTCKIKRCPQYKIACKCEQCHGDIYHIIEKYNRVIVCPICIKENYQPKKALLCCKCIKSNDVFIDGLRVLLKQFFEKAEPRLADIVEKWSYPFVQDHIVNCRMCHKRYCSKHLMKRLCRECEIKQQHDVNISRSKKRLEAHTEYDIFPLFPE